MITVPRGGRHVTTALPKFLDGCEPFKHLAEWRERTSPYATERSWEVRSAGALGVVCVLRWSLRGQCAGVSRTARDAEEAVWRALTQFYEWEAQAT